MPRFPSIAQHSFELYEYGSGITADTISPAINGFSFFCWICLDSQVQNTQFCRRRVILNLIDNEYRGFEVFISQQNEIIIASLSKTDYCWFRIGFHSYIFLQQKRFIKGRFYRNTCGNKCVARLEKTSNMIV